MARLRRLRFRSPHASWPRSIEQARHILDVQLLKAREARLAQKLFRSCRAHASSKTWPSLRERLGHTMEDAEAIINGAESIDVVLEPISGLGLHNEQNTIRIQQRSDLRQRGMRGREVMDAVARGYQIETAICIEFAGRLREKLQMRTYPGRCRGRACPRDRVSVWIDRSGFTIGKSL